MTSQFPIVITSSKVIAKKLSPTFIVRRKNIISARDETCTVVEVPSNQWSESAYAQSFILSQVVTPCQKNYFSYAGEGWVICDVFQQKLNCWWRYMKDGLCGSWTNCLLGLFGPKNYVTTILLNAGNYLLRDTLLHPGKRELSVARDLCICVLLYWPL